MDLPSDRCKTCRYIVCGLLNEGRKQTTAEGRYISSSKGGKPVTHRKRSISVIACNRPYNYNCLKIDARFDLQNPVAGFLVC